MNKTQDQTDDDHDLRPSYQNLQPARHEWPRWKKYMYMLDIFAFLPTPRTYPVSTKRSLIGSMILFALFLGYIVYSFVDFLLSNVPKVTQFTQQDRSEYNTSAPQMAIQFLYGDPFSEQINDPTLFTITMQEIVKFKDPSKADLKNEIPMMKCRPSWIPDSASPPEFVFWCPALPLNMSGLMYSTETFVYPRFSINYCDPQQYICQSTDMMRNRTAGGRLFLYIKNDAPDVNFVTGKQADVVAYQAYQYFLVYGMYNRAELVLRKQNVTVTGNYFTEFQTKQDQFISVNEQILYVTNVTYNGVSASQKAFQIWIRLSQEMMMVQVVKVTIVDIISKWGAFWGVLFAGFAFYFLKFNSNQFYSKNPAWYLFEIKDRFTFDEKAQLKQDE